MKKILSVITSILFLVPVHNVHAQTNDQPNCSICQQASTTFTRYIQFVYDTLNGIQAVGKQENITGKPATPWLFQKSALTLKNTDPWEKTSVITTNNITRKLQTSVIASVLFAQDTIELSTTDLLLGLSSSFKNKWFQRDLETLYDLDELIDQKKLQLAEAWSFFSKATAQDRDAIQQIINNYTTDLLDPTRSYINNNLHYNEIIHILEQSQQKRKYLIMRNLTNQFIETDSKSWLTKGQFISTQQHNITIAYKPDTIQKTQVEYQCGRWVNSCDTDIKSFSKSMGQNIKQQGNAMKEALKRFWQSAQNLGLLFRKNANQLSEKNQEKYESFLQRKNELASSYHWLDGQYTKWDMREKIALTTNWKNLIQSMINNYQNKHTTQQKSKPSSQQQNKVNTTIASNKKQLSSSFKNRLEKDLNEVLISASLHSDMAETSNPQKLTNMIPPLNKQVENITIIIGDRERKNSIIKNLGIACEKQCSNAGWICRY